MVNTNLDTNAANNWFSKHQAWYFKHGLEYCRCQRRGICWWTKCAAPIASWNLSIRGYEISKMLDIVCWNWCLKYPSTNPDAVYYLPIRNIKTTHIPHQLVSPITSNRCGYRFNPILPMGNNVHGSTHAQAKISRLSTSAGSLLSTVSFPTDVDIRSNNKNRQQISIGWNQ